MLCLSIGFDGRHPFLQRLLCLLIGHGAGGLQLHALGDGQVQRQARTPAEHAAGQADRGTGGERREERVDSHGLRWKAAKNKQNVVE